MSFSSNHGVFFGEKGDVPYFAAKVRDFYLSKNLKPRIDLVFSENYDQELFEIFKKYGFLHREKRENIICMVKDRPAKKLLLRPIEISRQEIWDDRLTENIIGPGYDAYMPRVLQKSILNKNCNFFVASLFGEPVSMCMITEGKNVSCLSSVMTGMGFRGCSFASKMLSFVAEEYKNISSKPLYLLTDNNSAVPLYASAGFSKIDFPNIYYSLIYKY